MTQQAKPPDKENQTSSQKGLPSEWTRFAYIAKADYIEKVKVLACWDRKDIKEVMGSYLKGKKVKPIPTKKGSKNHAYKNRGYKNLRSQRD